MRENTRFDARSQESSTLINLSGCARAKYWSVHLGSRRMNGGRYERSDKEEFWQRPSHGATRPFCPTSTMLTPRVLLKHWFLLHIVMAHSSIKYALLAPSLPLPDTEHPEILSKARRPRRRRRWSVKLQLLSSYTIKWTPILFNPLHPFLVPFSVQTIQESAKSGR